MAGSCCGDDDMLESEALWEKLLPADHMKILSIADDPVEHSSKKELYFRLHQPLLLDGGTKSFMLDSATGKKCFMLSARELGITWGSDEQYWRWVNRPDSRFAEVAELVNVCWLVIHGDINSRVLSSNTTYAAYLVFKLPIDSSYGFAGQTQIASITVGDANPVESVVRLEAREEDEQEGSPEATPQRPPQSRKDGWMELCLGEFDIGGQPKDEMIRMSLSEVEALNWKSGLVVEGIEVRPKKLQDDKRCEAHGFCPVLGMLRCFPAPLLHCFTASRT